MIQHKDPEWRDFMKRSSVWRDFYQRLCGLDFFDEMIRHLDPTISRFGFKGLQFHELFQPDLYFFWGSTGYSCPIHVDSGTRLFSMMLYFDDCDGGEVVLCDRQKEAKRMIRTKANTLALWADCKDSYHGVLPVTSEVRRSVYISLRANRVLWDGHEATEN